MAEVNKSTSNNKESKDENNAKSLDHPPYTMKSIFLGKYTKLSCEYNAKDKAQTKDLLLPFQDDKTWKLLNNTFNTMKQPETSTTPNIHKPNKQYPAELKYLSKLFETLSEDHPASKLCKWLNDIRLYGTSGFPASMDISKIGDKTHKISPKQNGEEIYQTFFNKTLPFMKKLILSMPQIFSKKPTKPNTDNNNDNDNDEKKQNASSNSQPMSFMNPLSNAQIELTRGQIASILACCWFGIKLYEHCTFKIELHIVGTPAKLEMFIRYFDYVRQKGMDSEWFNNEKVTIWRRCLTAEQCACLEHDNLCKNDTVLCDFMVHEKGGIEDQIGQLQADFANEYIGGGVLEGGNVQEEIRFTVNTECIITKWFNPLPMRHNESIIIFGSQQFFDYSGYGSRFSFDGYRDNKKEMFFCEDKKDRLGSSVLIGIDAIYFFAPKEQINVDRMVREIGKSYVGYSIKNEDIGHKMDTVSTGNWGCGIFRGDPMLKAMLQWISITLSKRKVAYYTFSDPRVAAFSDGREGKLERIVKQILDKKITVGQLWTVLANPRFAVNYASGSFVDDMLGAELLGKK